MASLASSAAVANLGFSATLKTKTSGASRSEIIGNGDAFVSLSAANVSTKRGRIPATRSASVASPGASGKRSQRKVKAAAQPIAVATAIAPSPSAIKYELPTWAKFEMGQHPVFWETATGRPPAAGEALTIWFNPSACSLNPNPEFGVGFNGGFNSPIMCAGEPRVMSKKERGPQCDAFFTIKMNVPVHATHIEFSFTDGSEWVGPYYVQLEIPAKWRNLPTTFFNEGLAKELAEEGACETAIYPDAPYVKDRCLMASSMVHADSAFCELEIVPGCTDPESPMFDPLATHDDGSCPLEPEAKAADK